MVSCVHLIKLKFNPILTAWTRIVSACVTLKQTFINPSDVMTDQTKYVFPVPAHAAVCAFEMHFKDSKEKAQAAREYETAVQAGKAAALVDWVADDSM
jgi:hypothetical protein